MLFKYLAEDDATNVNILFLLLSSVILAVITNILKMQVQFYR